MDSAPTLTNYADAPARITRRNISSQQRQQLYSLLPQASAPPHNQGPLYFSSEDNSPASPSTSGSSWQQQLLPPSSARDDQQQARAAIREQYQQYQSDQQEQQVKREQGQHHQHTNSMVYNIDEKPSAQQPTLPSQQPRTAEDPMPSTSDFVKKLYKSVSADRSAYTRAFTSLFRRRMLEDPSFQSVVCWGPLGDCFVVKDMNEFTKSILPRMFKHSNFASFVRQLNKYDFHKVKNTDDNQFGEHVRHPFFSLLITPAYMRLPRQSWTFRHPDFHADRRDALENIKRKVPAQRKYTPSGSGSAAASGSVPSSSSAPYPPPQSGGASYPYPSSGYPASSAQGSSGSLHTVGGGARRSPSPTHTHLTSEIQRLKDEGDDLRGRIRNLERNYENVLVELVGFQRGMAQQDGLMQSLIGWFLEGGE